MFNATSLSHTLCLTHASAADNCTLQRKNFSNFSHRNRLPQMHVSNVHRVNEPFDLFCDPSTAEVDVKQKIYFRIFFCRENVGNAFRVVPKLKDTSLVR